MYDEYFVMRLFFLRRFGTVSTWIVVAASVLHTMVLARHVRFELCCCRGREQRPQHCRQHLEQEWMCVACTHDTHSVLDSATARFADACQQKSLVETWRAAFSRVPRTTSALAPFGITQLAGYCSEGYPWNTGAFRLAQTAGYGFLPNTAMPATFLGQAYDLGV